MRTSVLLVLSLAACQSTPTYGTSLLGEALPMPAFDDARRARLERDLIQARRDLDADPGSVDNWIWYGRRLAYLGRYQEAVAHFGQGLRAWPESYRLLRHRGHRFITLRRFDRAIEDLERAAELMPSSPLRTEPDGIPNARNTPISNTQGNVWYHLGLARYLAGDFEGALAAYDQRARHTDRNDDNRCATAYWRYLILARLGREAEARAAVAGIRADMDIIENHTYRDLCLLYQGSRCVEDLHAGGGERAEVLAGTLGYGLAMHRWLEQDREGGRQMWRKIVAGTASNASFGSIAAEAELARQPR